VKPAHEPQISPERAAPVRAMLSARPTIGHTIGLIVVALVAYAVWRGYQNPDLLLDLAAMRLC